ncbi:MAG: ClpXP protease specificity-enhancing factor SspB, partial [Caulobacterales bacterium]|nr:ClpXP protease specificity-enhancing factor SspB [Caulobacterales bacterium]
MADDQMRYDVMTREALRTVVRQALHRAAAEGLPGAHHFYITFRTHGDGVDIDP